MGRTQMQAWMVLAVLLGSMAYAVAEELTLTTYYPSPRGVYRELRVGSPNVSNPAAFLHVVGDGTRPGFKVDGGGGNQFVVDGSGNVGIGDAAPADRLHVVGNGRVTGNFDVSGNTDIGGNATVGGNATITGLTTTNGLTVTGAALFSGTVTIPSGSPDVGKVWSATGTGGDGTWDYPKYAP